METPGTAPGSDPLITSAFMSIVPLPRHDEYRVFGQRLEGGVDDAPFLKVHREQSECHDSFNHKEGDLLTRGISVGDN